MKNNKMKKKLFFAVPLALSISLITGCVENAEATTEVQTTTEVTTEAVEESSSQEAVEVTEAASEENSEAASEETSEAASEELQAGGEWTYGEYSYPGDDKLLGAIQNYMATEYSDYYSPADVVIPYSRILDVDSTDENDIKAYGSFWTMTYNLDGETLVNDAGGHYPGCIHLKKEGEDSYTVISFDVVEDGSNYEESAKKIFGDLYDSFTEMQSDDEGNKEARREFIYDYVSANNIPVTQYQDYGWDPVSIAP